MIRGQLNYTEKPDHLTDADWEWIKKPPPIIHGFRLPNRTHNPIPCILPGVEFDYEVDDRPDSLPHGEGNMLFIPNRTKCEKGKVVARTRLFCLEPNVMHTYFAWGPHYVLFSMTAWEDGRVEYTASYQVIDHASIYKWGHTWKEGAVVEALWPSVWPVQATWTREAWTVRRHRWMIERGIEWPTSALGELEAKRAALNRWMRMEQQRKAEGLPVMTNWLRIGPATRGHYSNLETS